ncbi:hypothetical protein T440DRAFT_471163 [Plenodomus tracheiphilus IPT5]|uniref:SUN domain-containing protein n=1 Tax=Plenodomus tracheiphilus IPT5 TaxID=1408161 RepID=A0A6A7AVZ0_9PLEO|nr:hypothetical protein T440DRAFT_471163 [Plenodomus tracheiphilus IPT5]
MPTIGAPLRKWTLLLLLCSVPTYAIDHAANEDSTANPSATAASSGTTPATTAGVASPSPSSARKYNDSETVCPARTINYITHTLPQQCAKASWSAPGSAGSTNIAAAEAQATAVTRPDTAEGGVNAESLLDDAISSAISSIASHAQETGSVHSTVHSAASGTTSESEAELETDSPFDNANFLSFEEWKKKNLEQVGQSPENVGQGRASPSGQPARRRPVNVNALDSLGDEGEIEIDFSGFGNPEDKENTAGHKRQGTQDAGATKASGEEGKAAPSSWVLSKDAGKTCKERFNYASFDCAATVLKTNKQAKSSTSILVENKDSYMLNECSADNKFLIVELCDDIYVDTVVLANYEFFSSMFRHFRVSVSDRYPVKMERWRTLGTFEARNSRDIQPFLIAEPQIWARYLRIEFLTQFGNEFYCPLSLLRVHGTTMMEQFRREEEEARGIDDDDSDLEAESRDVVKPAADSGPLPPDQIPIQPIKEDEQRIHDSSTNEMAVSSTASSNPDDVPSQPGQPGQEPDISSGSTTVAPASPSSEAASSTMVEVSSSPAVKQRGTSSEINSLANLTSTASGVSSSSTPTGSDVAPQDHGRASNASNVISSPTAPSTRGSTNSISTATGSPSSATAPSKATNNTTGASPPVPPSSRGSSTQPNAAVPSTQESFFKSIHKRLLYLEANSTLSLQYIEEQSRSLRDAFLKVEKRQLAKTEKFLNHLNSTVMLELKGFRNMYDQLWQSTVIELESMKERQKSEMGEIGARLSLLADELVWQKRMAVVQSTLLLVCLGLVLFVRSGPLGVSGSAVGSDIPIVQHLGSKFFETPPRGVQGQTESGVARRRRTFRNMWRSDTSAGLSDQHSDAQHVLSDAETDGARSPLQNEYRGVNVSGSGSGSGSGSPTEDSPDTPAALAAHDVRNGLDGITPDDRDGHGEMDVDNDVDTSDPDPDDQAARIQVLETQSGPATPNGTRDSRPSWEEVDRAMDELKAEAQAAENHTANHNRKSKNSGGIGGGGIDGLKEDRATKASTKSLGTEKRVEMGKGKAKGLGKGKKKSPLRRAYSSYEGRNGDVVDGGGRE